MQEKIKKFLDLAPDKFLCPFCGERHKLLYKGRKLSYYYSDEQSMWLKCPKCPDDNGNNWDVKLYVKEEKLHVCFKTCYKADLEKAINVSFVEAGDNVIRWGCNNYSCGCIDCSAYGECTRSYPLGFEFSEKEWKKLEEHQKEDKSMNNESNTEKTMKNPFNIKWEFGINKDSNLTSTLMGVAVKVNESWRIYNKTKNEITNIGNLQFGNLPIFIIPATKVDVGDLIKEDDGYYYVINNESMLSAATGEIKRMIPTKNLFGFKVFVKVVAFSDSLNLGDELTGEKLAIMAMCGQSAENGSINQMLPLLLLKDKLGGGDDSMVLAMMAMCCQSEENNDINQMLPLFLLKDKLGVAGNSNPTTNIGVGNYNQNKSENNNPSFNIGVENNE